MSLDDVTVHELDFPRPDMGALDADRGELYVSRGMPEGDRAVLLARLAG